MSEIALQHHVEIGADPHAAARLLAGLVQSDQNAGVDLPHGLPAHVVYREPDGPDRIPAPATVAHEGAAACGALTRAEASKGLATHIGVCRAAGADGKPVHHAFFIAAAKPGELPLVTGPDGKSLGPVDMKRVRDPSKDRGMNCGCHVPSHLYQEAAFHAVRPEGLHPEHHEGAARALVCASPAERAAAGVGYQGAPRAHRPTTAAGLAVSEVGALAARAVTPPRGHEPRPVHELHPHPAAPHPEADAPHASPFQNDPDGEHLTRATVELAGALHSIAGGQNPHPLPEDPPVTEAHAEAARKMIGTLVNVAKGTPAHELHDDPTAQAQALALVPAHEQVKIKAKVLDAAAALEHVDGSKPDADAALTVASELDAILPTVLPPEVGNALRRRRAGHRARAFISATPIEVGSEPDSSLAMGLALMVALDDLSVGCPGDGRRPPPPDHAIRPAPPPPPPPDAPVGGLAGHSRDVELPGQTAASLAAEYSVGSRPGWLTELQAANGGQPTSETAPLAVGTSWKIPRAWWPASWQDPPVGHGGGSGGHGGGHGGGGGGGWSGLGYVDCGPGPLDLDLGLEGIFVPGTNIRSDGFDPRRAEQSRRVIAEEQARPGIYVRRDGHHGGGVDVGRGLAAAFTGGLSEAARVGSQVVEEVEPVWDLIPEHRAEYERRHLEWERRRRGHREVVREFVREPWRRGVHHGPDVRVAGWFGPDTDDQGAPLVVGRSRQGHSTWGGPQNGWVPTETWLAGYLSPGGHFCDVPVAGLGDKDESLACRLLTDGTVDAPVGWIGWDYRGRDRVVHDRRAANALRRYWRDMEFRRRLDRGEVVDGLDLAALHEVLDPPVSGWWDRWRDRRLARERRIDGERAREAGWWRRDRTWDRGWDWWQARIPAGHKRGEWFRRFHSDPDFRRRAEAGEVIDGLDLAAVLAWANGVVPGAVPDPVVGFLGMPVGGKYAGSYGASKYASSYGAAQAAALARAAAQQAAATRAALAAQPTVDQWGNTLDAYGNPVYGPGGGPVAGPVDALGNTLNAVGVPIHGPGGGPIVAAPFVPGLQVGLRGVPRADDPLYGVPIELLESEIQCGGGVAGAVNQGVQDARRAMKGRPCPTGRCPRSGG